MAVILTTTGISLLSNTGRHLGIKVPTEDQMRHYLYAEPHRAASETNSLLRMNIRKDDQLVLFHTQDTRAIQCAQLLRDFFHNEGYKHVRLVQLTLQADPKQIEAVGLRDLIDVLANEIEKAQNNNQEVLINATAGYKALVVYSTLLGMIYHVPVKYLYEEFPSVITFNPVAVDWNTDLFLTYENFFRWIHEQARTIQAVDNFLNQLYEGERIRSFLTLPDTDGHIWLSDTGEILYKKFRHEKEAAEQVEWPKSSGIKNINDKISTSILDRKHHSVKDDLKACYKVAELDCVREIIGGYQANTTRKAVRLLSMDGKEGLILLRWADDQFAAHFTIFTTAESKAQTLKVAQKIKEILEIS